jgi:hypothetical protein
LKKWRKRHRECESVEQSKIERDIKNSMRRRSERHRESERVKQSEIE